MKFIGLIIALVSSEITMNEASGSVFNLINKATFFDQTQTVNLNIIVDSPADWLKNIKDHLFVSQVCL
jgi:hypothetical protein